MPKKFQTKIGPRDLEILTALDQTPLTTAQLCRLSTTFAAPFGNQDNLRRRLRSLTTSGLVKSWRYAIATDGPSPRYFRLSRDGFRLLYGSQAPLPRRRYFEEISHGHHYHTFSLAEFLVHLLVSAGRCGHSIERFTKENSVCLKAGTFSVWPDAAFVVRRPDGRTFPFVVELDNGTERVRSRLDTECIERKLRGYDAHQAQFDKFDENRYLVLFVTTRSAKRLDHILDFAGTVMQQPHRTVFLGCCLQSFVRCDPFCDAELRDHRGLKRMLIPQVTPATRATHPAQPGRLPVVA